MIRKEVDPRFIEQRLEDICKGLQEGIRREIERKMKLGIPYCVEENGKVVIIDPKRHTS